MMTETNQSHLGCSPSRVLLAEDDDDLRTLLALKLRDAGFDVTEASDGNDLLERLIDVASVDGGDDPFDIVLSDVNMPHFNAFDVLVGAHSCLGATPVVLMTSFCDAHTHAQALRLGAAAVLDKPLRLDDLPTTLVQILDQRGSATVKSH